MKKVITIIVCMILSLLVFSPMRVDAATETQIIEFGRQGSVGADISASAGIVSANAEFDFSAGIDWPVEVRMTHPDTISPGGNMQISIDTVGKSGGVWYKFYGHADCKVSTYVLAEKTINIPQTNLISLTVPIGENVTQNASSSQITVWTQRKDIDLLIADYYVEADIRFKFDFEVTTTSYVSGNVECEGTAIDTPINEYHEWGATYSNTIPISSAAEPGDSVDISVSNMKYVLEKVVVKIKTFYIYVGYYSDWSVLGSDSNAITTTVPISEFIPNPTTRADTRADGEFINTFGEVPVTSDFSASLVIPTPEDESDDDGSGDNGNGTSLLLPILAIVGIIAVVAIVILFMRKPKTPSSQNNQPPPPPTNP